MELFHRDEWQAYVEREAECERLEQRYGPKPLPIGGYWEARFEGADELDYYLDTDFEILIESQPRRVFAAMYVKPRDSDYSLENLRKAVDNAGSWFTSTELGREVARQ